MEATGVFCSKAAADRVSLEGSETFVEANSHKVTELPTNLSVWERAWERWCLFVSGWGVKVMYREGVGKLRDLLTSDLKTAALLF